MKRSVPLWVVVGMILMAAAVWARTRQTSLTFPGGDQVERYWLFQASYEFASGERTDIIFRVDTQTGQTWRYVPPVADKDIPEGWIVVGEIIDRDLVDEEGRFLP
jgi:hypothetical protein